MNFTDSPFEKMMKEKPRPPRLTLERKPPKARPKDRVKEPLAKAPESGTGRTMSRPKRRRGVPLYVWGNEDE